MPSTGSHAGIHFLARETLFFSFLVGSFRPSTRLTFGEQGDFPMGAESAAMSIPDAHVRPIASKSARIFANNGEEFQLTVPGRVSERVSA